MNGNNPMVLNTQQMYFKFQDKKFIFKNKNKKIYIKLVQNTGNAK